MRRTGLVSSRTLAIVAVSVFALIGCCLLAWWQWTRFQSASGTLQNLGYVLQWPLFGLFPGFMFWRIHRAAQRERAEAEAAEAGVAESRVPEAEPTPAASVEADDDWLASVTYVPNRQIDYESEVDPELLSYNAYLAKLAAREQPNER